ncbi:10066_t:CDS:1 [Dentiscutata heterogama]|uniref:10066_t:CDS:1 n=1 Tax=Dentiscutata heterogama TaxID=1316150 RepID=A0ACA9LRR6_9GLOM|nr:10066_t:CDS:1 [Dentiscutata heterogama]
MSEPRIKMPNIREIEQFNIDEFATISKGNKYLNAFFVYRKEYTKRSIASGKKMRMTQISKLASQAWKNEKPDIKNAYAEVSKRIEKRRQKERTYQIIFDVNVAKVQLENPNSPIFDQLDYPSNSDTPQYEESLIDANIFCESLTVDQLIEYYYYYFNFPFML